MLRRSIWSDWRILLAIPVALVLRMILGFAMGGGSIEVTSGAGEHGLHRSHPDQAEQSGGDAVLLERRIRKINLDGTPLRDPLSPLAAAAAFGGAILLVGGTLSLLSWRRASKAELAPEDQEEVVRNSADERQWSG